MPHTSSTQTGMPQALGTIVFLLLSLLTATHSKPYYDQNSTPQDIQTNRPSDKDYSLQHSQQSIYVRFAEEKPQLPPWSVGSQQAEPSSDSSSRSKRAATAQASHVAESVCDSVSSWEEKEASEDMWGNPVQIVNNIDVGGTRIVQYFYETYCHQTDPQENHCRGIDSEQYNSQCETKHMWAYAQVRTASNETGWTHIKIRGSCNCSLYRKQVRQSNIWDELLLL